ncbi:response regulator [uncultured Tateyamaria sp.]|uniref:response regulator n=1 Tax=uncultured Tateyamaria sp. TaxID=455651 RepID=UPI00261BE279|nr:response regulator [uncultured Tateyamaria sp.]
MSARKKVLLVEDDEFTRFMMKEIIATLGVDVEIATNGQDGCDVIAAAPESFGLILMDLHMPQMSGIDATRQIRALPANPPCDVPIIALTADVTYHDTMRVKKLGMNGFASKPVTPGQLLALIDEHCSAA